LFHGEPGYHREGEFQADRLPTQRRLTLAELKRRLGGGDR